MNAHRTLLTLAGIATGSLLFAATSSTVDEAAAARRLVMQQANRMAESVLGSQASDGSDECAFVVDLAEYASVRSLQNDLALAVASCVNEESGTIAKFLECLDEAFGEFADGLEELAEVTAGRTELCALTGGGIYDPDLDEDDFVEGVYHQYLPYTVGSEWIYQKMTDEGLEEITVTVLPGTKEIDEIDCIIVQDVVTLDGELVEDTLDWYAQHEDGTVWYMGEIAKNYEDGELVDLDGSWIAGEDGGQPGVVMMATPVVGTTYRQELLLLEAEDAGTVLSVSESVDVAFGSFTDCLQTLDFTPLEPGHLEHKYYAPGVGLVLEVDPESGERLELISYTPGR